MTADSISAHQKAVRARTWYSLYSLEIALEELTGRPCSILLADVSAPLDAIQDDLASDASDGLIDMDGVSPEEPVPWHVFLQTKERLASAHASCRVRLSMISQKIFSSVYVAGHEMSWGDIQDMIRGCELELQQWLVNLPRDLTPDAMEPSSNGVNLGLELALYYWSVRMILLRPCLCDLEGRIENESRTSRTFNRMAAVACVDAGRSLLALIPDEPAPHDAYLLLPWWMLLHYICQAAAVLTLELCLGAQHAPTQVGEIVAGLKKAVSYLRFMSVESLSAFKAWKIFRHLLSVSTSKFGIDISDVPADAPQPPGWTPIHEMRLAKALDDKKGNRRSPASPILSMGLGLGLGLGGVPSPTARAGHPPFHDWPGK